MANSMNGEAAFVIRDMTVGFMRNPLGIETDSVFFGWKMDSDLIGEMQAAYRIWVLTDGGLSVWDSGKQAAAVSTGIACEGRLAERTRYRWQVTVWDQNGNTASQEDFFETGVADWQVWKNTPFMRMREDAAAPIFRTERKLEGGKVCRARLYITALGAYQAYINGRRVGEIQADGSILYHHMNPGYGNGSVSLGYQAYDVTEFLQGFSAAAVSIVGGSGWYNGMGSTVSCPAVKALLVINDTDGNELLITTESAGWRGTLKGGITANGVYYGEDYNAVYAEKLGDFTQVGYDDSKWGDIGGFGAWKAEYAGKIRSQLAVPGKWNPKYDQKPVSAVIYRGMRTGSSYAGGEINVIHSFEAVSGESLFGKGILLAEGETMIVNMGQNLTAVPEIRLSGRRGAKVTLRFAEMLNDGSTVGNAPTQADGPKGSVYQKSIRGARARVTYILAGHKMEKYQPSMSFFGYQYVEITAEAAITVYDLRSRAISSVTKKTGNIVTNNKNVNRLFSNVLYGQMSNYYTTPTDCNQRDERLSWTGDTQVFAQTAVYNFDSAAFLWEMQKIYEENAWIKGYVPAVADCIWGFFDNWAAGWSDVLVVIPWVLYLQTGNRGFLSESWDILVHYMDYLKSIERGRDQAPAPNNGMNYGDWLSFQGTSVEFMNDCYYGYINQIMAEISRALGKTEKEQEYRDKWNAIKKKFLETHVERNGGKLIVKSKQGNISLQFQAETDKKGIWENNSQTALLWMLKLGFYDGEEMGAALRELLLKNIKNENPEAGSIRARYGSNTLAAGFLGSNVITPVLSDIGYGDVSYDLLLQDEQPSWLFEVKAGATTVWERWNSYTPGVGFGDCEMNSFNHYAYGSVVEWMYRYMAGISTDKKQPGFKNIILQPVLDTGKQYNEEERIEAVDASYESYYGRIAVSWRSRGGKLISYSAKIPANTTAKLYLPVEESAAEGLEEIPGASYNGMTAHNRQQTAEFTLVSGGYEFTVESGKLRAANKNCK